MASLSGLFESFDNLDQIDLNSLSEWLKSVPVQAIQIENYLANKILYPSFLPISSTDMKIEMAMLREILRINGPKDNKVNDELLGENPFLNIALRKILIPEKFLDFTPNLVGLTWAFIDGLLLNRKKKDVFEDLWTVVLTGESDEIVGSVLLPEFNAINQDLNISIQGENYEIKAGSLTRINCSGARCEVTYNFINGSLLGKNSGAVELYGGKLGLMVDGRNIQ